MMKPTATLAFVTAPKNGVIHVPKLKQETEKAAWNIFDSLFAIQQSASRTPKSASRERLNAPGGVSLDKVGLGSAGQPSGGRTVGGSSSDTLGSQTQHAKTVCFNDMFTRMAGGSAGGAILREQFAAFLQENGRQLLGAEEEEEEELQALLSDMVDEAFQTTAQLSRAQFIAFLSSTSDAPCLDADAPPGPPCDADLGGGRG